MKKGWEVKKLSDVCEIINGGTPKTKIAEYWDGDFKWITPKDMGKLKTKYVNDTSRKITELGLQKSSAKLISRGSVILSTRAPIGHLAINLSEMATNQGCRGIIPSSSINLYYLFYFLTKSVKMLNNLGTGTTFKELSKTALSSVEIPLPPLPEQKRIVSILDKTFTAIDQAQANTEQNLQNAKEVFESYLQSVFENRGESWEVKKLGDVCEIYQPKTISKKNMIDDGAYPVFGANGIIGKYNKFNHEEPQLLVTCRGATCGSVNISKPYSWINGNAMVIKPLDSSLDVRFVEYFFRGVIDITKTITGAAQPQITRQSLSPVLISYPKSLSEQKRIVQKLDSLSTETQNLEAIYQQKLDNLEELKQSILQKAFNGELT